MEYEQVKAQLRQRGQEHLLRYYDELSKEGQERLLNEIAAIDWEIYSQPPQAESGEILPIEGLSIGKIAKKRESFFRLGEEEIRKGRVAAVLLAGGQGTRLGNDAPKGTFDMGLTRPLYIFQLLRERLKKQCASCGGRIPLFIMTSEKNDGETRAFLQEHDYFGYPSGDVFFFVQQMAAATDLNGKILLEGKGALALSPNGNGGWYSSLCRAGLDGELKRRGTAWLNVFAVDNVLQGMADPVFIGATIACDCPCGAKVVRKNAPEERVGVLCLKGGKPHVVEYYELPDEMRNARDGEGNLLYAFGVTLNYLFRLDRLEEIAGGRIPVHTVKKKVPYLDGEGNYVFPQQENGLKYETLILDMVRLMGKCLPFEVEREKEFAPVKNRSGVDSVDTARELLKQNGVEL